MDSNAGFHVGTAGKPKVKVLGSIAPTIFVIDDDPAVRNSLKFMLELEGYQVRLYRDAPALLGAEDLEVPGCFVIDLKLPGIDGFELLDELRRRKVTTPAVLMTSHPSAITRQRATCEGIVIVEKPLLDDALSKSIRQAIGRPAAHR